MENKTEEKELSRDMQSFSQLEQLGEEFRDVAQRLETSSRFIGKSPKPTTWTAWRSWQGSWGTWACASARPGQDF